MGAKKDTKYYRLEFDPSTHQAFKVWSVANQIPMSTTILTLVNELLKADKGDYSSIDIDSFREMLLEPEPEQEPEPKTKAKNSSPV